MKNLLLIVCLLMLTTLSGSVLAQTVTGKVTGQADGLPLPGVSVLIKGTSTGTATDVDGNYSLNVPGSETVLVFSYLGFETVEQTVGNRNTINVILAEDAEELSEVVVTALGIERNVRALQYSITEVGGEEFTQARENNIANQLAGRVAGVNVSNVASGPAGSSRVIIRGNTSLQGGNQPLYVIDGIPMDNTNFGQAGVWGGADQGDGMTSVNPDDIESMSVLKGASAAALYGSRAANGVILITTKRGTAQRGIGVEVNSNVVFERINNQTDLQTEFGSGRFQGDQITGAAERPTTVRQGYDWGTQAWGERLGTGTSMHFDGVERPYVYAGDNWNRFYETGAAYTNSISLSGGSEAQTFRFNATDMRSTSVVPNAGFDRLNMSIATNGKFGKKLTFDAKVLYSNERTKNRPRLSDSPGNAFQSIFALPPNVNVEWGKGDPNRLGTIPVGTDPDLLSTWGFAEQEEYLMTNNPWGQNPYFSTYQLSIDDTRDRIITSGSLRYDITDHLYLSGRAGMDWFTRRGTTLTPQGTGYDRNGSMSESERRVNEINLEAMLGYDRQFGDFALNAFVGANRMRREDETISANGQGFNVPFFHAINNTVTRNFGYGYSGWGINSVFGSAEVSYKNIIFLTATGRTDWFSVLDPQFNDITYPSLGGSFVFSDALTELPVWLSFGKIRGSWARVGNSTVGPYQIQNVYSLLGAPAIDFGGNQVAMASFATAGGNAGTIPNRFLKPLLSTEIEMGFDVRFFQNRLGLDFTYYRQRSTDDQLNAQVSRASGFGSTLVNLGEMENRGIEVLLTGSPVRTNSFNWDISFNVARNRNEVISLIEGSSILNVEEPRTRTVFVQHRTGYPFGVLAGWVQKKSPDGQPVFEENGAPVQSDQMEVIGNGIPDWTGGVNNSITFKGFNLSALVDFRIGGDLYSGTNVRLTQWGLHKQTLQGRAGEEPLTVSGVIQSGTDADGDPIYESFTKTLSPGEANNYWNQMGNRVQDFFVYDGSFAKLRQVTFGYNFPRSILSNTPFTNLNISFVGRNLSILWKNVENIDPESGYSSGNGQGLDYFGMPQTRTFGFNVRATF
ncbi:TonB-linked outer membrane protein, SusC/RagA family [Cyclobacterium lianum]|uniref:TonB-linked outer membrane protein, SusC/RagA family n=1 Tax=Cyclobacterium lianum TaxID=388280 RepID=A0A1M7QCD9_9BACT|nr:SusC/RagA family TonB-linked outer membrane protein [Cyclobacterium lianum]SHN28344.1 TonB-linked outer membrane protein, SusC/RagA family [Cyclobacterium lianum]